MELPHVQAAETITDHQYDPRRQTEHEALRGSGPLRLEGVDHDRKSDTEDRAEQDRVGDEVVGDLGRGVQQRLSTRAPIVAPVPLVEGVTSRSAHDGARDDPTNGVVPRAARQSPPRHDGEDECGGQHEGVAEHEGPALLLQVQQRQRLPPLDRDGEGEDQYRRRSQDRDDAAWPPVALYGSHRQSVHEYSPDSEDSVHQLLFVGQGLSVPIVFSRNEQFAHKNYSTFI